MIFLLYKLYFLSPYTNPTPKPSLTENVLHVLMQNITILMQNIKKILKKNSMLLNFSITGKQEVSYSMLSSLYTFVFINYQCAGTRANTHTFTNTRACVCVRVRVYMVYDMRTYICIITWVWHRYNKEKVLFEDNFSVPIIQKAYKSYRISFLRK